MVLSGCNFLLVASRLHCWLVDVCSLQENNPSSLEASVNFFVSPHDSGSVVESTVTHCGVKLTTSSRQFLGATAQAYMQCGMQYPLTRIENHEGKTCHLGLIFAAWVTYVSI